MTLQMSNALLDRITLTCGRPGCEERTWDDRQLAHVLGWLIASPDRSVPVFCPLHGAELADGRQTFGPEYRVIDSRVPAEGDLLIDSTGIYTRERGQWTPATEVAA